MGDTPCTFSSSEQQGQYVVFANESSQGGMTVLYDITDIFLNAVINHKLFPDDFLTEERFPDLDSLSSNFVTEVTENIQQIVMANVALLTTFLFGILFVLATLIGGCVFCCCFSNKKIKKTGDSSLKTIFHSIVTFVLLIISALGCVWFFLGAKTAEKGLDQIPEEIGGILHDGDLYINNTVGQLEHLLGKNFDETVDCFDVALHNTVDQFQEFTDNITREIKLDEVIVQVESFISLMTDDYAGLSIEMGKITESVRKIKDDMTTLDVQLTSGLCLTPTLQEQCAAAHAVITEAKKTIDKLPTPTFNEIDTTQIVGLKKTLDDILIQVNSISDGVEEKYFAGIRDQIEDIRIELDDMIGQIIEPIEDIQNSLFRKDGIIDELENIRDNFFPYFNISLLVLGSILAAILSIFMVTMCLGSCSKQGSGVATTAASIIFISNGTFFFLAILLFILCIAFFTVGAISEKLICHTMENPAESEWLTFGNIFISDEITNIYNDIRHDMGEVEDIEVDIKLADFIDQIHNDAALYPLLQLDFIFNITALTNWKSTYNIDSAIDDAKGQIHEIIEGFADYKNEVESAKSDVTDIGHTVDAVIDKNFVDIILNETLISNLTSMQESISAQAGNFEDPIKNKFEEIENEIDTLKTSIESFQATLRNVTDKFGVPDGGLDLSSHIQDIFTLIEAAFVYFETTEEVDNFFDSTVASITKVVDEFVNFAIHETNENIGATKPLSNIYNATYTGFCQDIVAPFNSVWSGLGWCLLLILLPVTLVLTSLRAIYRSQIETPNFRQHQNPAARVVSYEEVAMPHYTKASAPPQYEPKYRVPPKYQR